MTTGVPLMKSVLTPLAKSVLMPLGLPAEMWVADAAVQKIIDGSGSNTFNWRNGINNKNS